MKFDVIQSNFTAGELSPKLKGRVDLEKYTAGLAVCENMVVQPSGGVFKRGGFRYVTEVKNSAKTTILIAFRYNDLYSYILEFGVNYIRVYFENEQIQSGGSPYEIATTYLENEVAGIRVTQDATNLYLVHKNHPPAILTRTDHDAWTLEDIPFSFDYSYEDTWESACDSISGEYWTSVCWSPELGKVVAVSKYNAIMVSSNGVTWTPVRQNYLDGPIVPWYSWASVCWSPLLGLFVAVTTILGSSTAGVATSANGVNWEINESLAENWSSVCWSPDLELFVACSYQGTFMISGDGVTWDLVTPSTQYQLESICWSTELSLFCAVGSSGGTDRVCTSPDGATWTYRTAANDNEWDSVCWSPSQMLFVAVAKELGTDSVMTSPDGVTWTARTPASSKYWDCVLWAEELGLFIAGAFGGDYDRIMTSPDGITWTSRTPPDYFSCSSLCWAPELALLISVAFTSLFDKRVMTSPGGVTWTIIADIDLNNDWQAICWSPELSLFCAVSSSGGGNRVMTSPDGVLWVAQVSIVDNDWRSVCWSPLLELFCAVSDTGSNSRMMTSARGVTWELAQEIGQTVDNDWQSICWSPDLTLFVAVADTGTNNRIMTSSDGVVWSTVTPPADNDWQSVCWSPDLTLFCAVASSGTGNRVMTSPDGVVWTLQTSAVDNDWTSVCWASELTLFVAVASSGTGDRVMTSPDGATWTVRVSSIDNTWTSVCWSPDLTLLVAVAATVSPTNVMTSPDGVNWTTRTTGLNSVWTSVCWSPTALRFVAVAPVGSSLGMYSSDGVTWVANEAGMQIRWVYRSPGGEIIDRIPFYFPLKTVCWSSTVNKFVAMGGGDPALPDDATYTWTSSDGVSWDFTALQKNSWKSVCDAPEISLLAAVSSTGVGNRVITSSNAINWDTWDFELQNNEWSSVCWSQELRIFVAVSTVGDKRVGVSATGKSWWFYEAASGNTWTSICWSPEKELFVVVASSGAGNRVMTSPDGKVWTSRTSPVDNRWQSVCWSPKLSLFCAVSNNGVSNRVMTSPNGIEWTSRESVKDNEWYSVCWGEEVEKFVAVASSGTGDRIMTSSDGVVWESGENLVDNNWKGICWSPELKRFVAVADTGTEKRVMYSTTTYESWSSFDEYPSLVWFYEQRLFFAATTENPNMIWGSKSADFYNMSVGDGLDNDAIKLDIKAAYNFLWVSAGGEILIGGSNAEFSLSANALNEALTPSNVRPALRTKFGGTTVPPIRVDDSVVFTQQGFRKLRRLVSSSQVGGYSDRYKASDLTLLSDHITESGVIGAVSQTVKNTVVWAFRNDGELIGLSYEPEHDIFGWHLHKIGGTDVKIQSLAVAEVVATGGNQMQDEVWAVVSRTINGSTKKYIEYMRDGLPDESPIEDSFFVDSGVTETGTGVTVINDLGHLEGETVAILGDGVEQVSKVVSSGTITIDTASDKIQVGLPFTSIIETLPLEGGNPVGTSQGLIKRITSITLRLYRSLGADVGDTDGNVDSYNFGSTELFTGDTEPIPFAGGHDRQSRVKISSIHPLPLNILSIMSQARTK